MSLCHVSVLLVCWPLCLLAVPAQEEDALIKAVRGNDPLQVAYLISQHPEWREREDANGQAPLALAVWEGNLEAAATLLRAGVKTHDGPNDASVLESAALSGRSGSVALLLAFGMKPEEKSKLGDTAIGLSIQARRLEAFRLMLANLVVRGVKVDDSLLEVAVRAGADEIAELLLHAGANPSGYNQFALRTPQEIEQFLKQHPNFDINSAQDVFGLTPLHYAAMAGRLDTIELLVKTGATPSDRGRLGSPLHWAARNGRSNCIEPLIRLGLGVNKLTAWGLDSPLSWAAAFGNAETVRVLLKNGASVDIRGWGGLSPVELAKKHGKAESVKVLEEFERGNDLNRPVQNLRPEPKKPAGPEKPGAEGKTDGKDGP